MRNECPLPAPPLESLRKQIREVLFHPETELIYDYATSRDPVHRFDHLPAPEEVAADFPNPCGWSTGMEDSMLNAGSMLDVLRLEREDGDSPETAPAFACRLLHGIHRCATVHGHPGFVARSITPRDGKSCYSNSSRDQFTLAVYGVWRFLRAFPDAPSAEIQRARELLHSIACYCEHTVTAGHEYDLGRLDGGRAIVSKMWQCGAHEVLRLPMIYAAAFEATGDGHWRDAARKYAIPALPVTLGVSARECYWDIPTAQLQISLRFFRETDLFPELRNGLSSAMKRVTQLARPQLQRLLARALAFEGDWGAFCENWRFLPMKIIPQTISPRGDTAVFDGKTYLNPCFNAAYAEPNSLLRGIGNCLIAVLLDDSAALDRIEVDSLQTLLEKVNFTLCTGSGTVQLLHGCRLALHRGAEHSLSNATITQEVLHEEEFHSY